MALPRPILFALVGLVLVVGAFFATSSGRDSAEPAPPVAENVEPAPGADVAPAEPTKQDAVAVEPNAKEQSLREANAKAKAQREDAKRQAAEERAETRPEKGNSQADKGNTQPEKGQVQKVSDKPAPAKPAPLKPDQRLARALRRNSVVVMFFRQRGADDNATAAAVASLRGRKRIGVMVLPIGKAPRYSAALSGITVSRAPSVVLLARKRRPVLIEGYIDSATLRQAVADLR